MSTETSDAQDPLETRGRAGQMDDQNETSRSNNNNSDEKFPGYPHYPAKEDIFYPGNSNEKVDVDVENITRSPDRIRLQEKQHVSTPIDNKDAFGNENLEDDLGIVDGTDADVTEDDLLILESVEGNIIRAKEEDLVTTDSISDINDEDLDLPGTELDDDNERIGEEDEENNYYSIGSDREDLLEDTHE